MAANDKRDIIPAMFKVASLSILICGCFLISASAQIRSMRTNSTKVEIVRLKKDFAITELSNKAWKKANEIAISKYWSGAEAPAGRHFTAKMLWSDAALYVKFEAKQAEPLILSDKPDLTKKTRGLWDRDVCEIFIAPNPKEFRKYFEFEVAPTGEWIDLGVHQMPDKRETDWDYRSNMETAAKIESDKVVMAIKIPFAALGGAPKSGDKWLGNIFRCVGSGETRGYLTWQPTKTPQPNFHAPTAFGEFEF